MKSPEPQDTGELLTPAQFAERAHVTRQTIYAWIQSGVIDAKRFGPRKLLIRADQLDAVGQPVGLNAYRRTA